ncbi:hypothetical protein ACFY7Z_13195 [Streptomyces sp. NPDC012623]
MKGEDRRQRRVMVALISMGLTLIACAAAVTALVIALVADAI